MSARLSALLTAALLATPAVPLPGQTGVHYTIAMSDGAGRPSHADVTVLGDRSRIQPLHDQGDDETRSGKSYMIIRDGKLYSVDPDKHSYDVMSTDEFEQIVGMALRSVSPMVKMHVDDVDISAEEISDATKLLGYPTKHLRLTQRFTVRVSAFGMSADDEATENEVVTDYWVAPAAKLPRNPLIELMISAPTAPAQQSRSFARESSKARDSLFTGMPLRVIVRAREKRDGALVEKARAEVTRIDRASVDATTFDVPPGYTKTGGSRSHFSL